VTTLAIALLIALPVSVHADDASDKGILDILSGMLHALSGIIAALPSQSFAPSNFSGAGSTPVSTQTFAQSQRIDNLANVTISNATMTGISGIIDLLTAAAATITNLIVTTIQGTSATFTNATTTNSTTTNLAVTGRSYFASNVGIGTSSPTAILTLDSSSATGTILRVSNSSAGGHIYDWLSTGSGNTNGAGRLDIYDLTAGLPRFSITPNGNVGVGTTSPFTKLALAGNAFFSGNLNVGDAATTRGNLGLSYAGTSSAVYAPYNIVAWGDSLTAGNEDGTGVTYPASLSSDLSGRPVSNQGVGGQTSIQIAARMLAATSTFAETTIIWAGRNNYASTTQVESDIASMVSSLGENSHYLILSILNGSGSTEWSGTTGYSQITSLNNYLATLYPGHYLDVRSYLIQRGLSDAGIMPSAQDLTDIGHDVPPSDLRYDGIHLNGVGYTLIAQQIANFITTTLDTSGSSVGVLIPSSVPSIFASPYPIGAVAPNTAAFSTLRLLSNSGASAFTGITPLNEFIQTSVTGNLAGLDFGDSNKNAYPLARIAMVAAGNGSYLRFGTSANYPSGVTNTAMTIDPFGNLGVGTTSPGSIFSVQGVANWTTSTSTYYSSGGINLTAGCFSINGACISTGGGSGNVGSGAAGQFPYYGSGGSTLTATSSLSLSVAGYVGIGTTTPGELLHLYGNSGSNSFTGTSPTTEMLQTSAAGVGKYVGLDFGDAGRSPTNPLARIAMYTGSAGSYLQFGTTNNWSLGVAGAWVTLDPNGNLGVGTSTPAAKLDVVGGVGNTAINLETTSSNNLTDTLTLAFKNYGGIAGGKIVSGRDGIYGGSSFTQASNLEFYTATNGVDVERLRLTSVGNVGIGTTSPYARLTVWGPDSAASTTAFLVANNASTTEFAVLDNGNATLAGNLIQNSDQRLKTNIQSLEGSSSLALIGSLNPVTYSWIDPEKGVRPQYGFIAQQVLKVFPNLVSSTSPTALTPDGTLSLNYNGFIAPLVAAVQQTSRQLNSLTGAIAGFADHFTTKELTFTRATGEEIYVQKLCIGVTCVTESQLQALLNQVGQQSSAPSAPSPSESSDATSTPEAIDTPSIQPKELIATGTDSQQ
jgi:hypothetical protein